MSFIALLVALLMEQARPLSAENPVHRGVSDWVFAVIRNFDAGKTQHAWLAWGIAVGCPVLLVTVIHWVLLANAGWPAALVWHTVVLYVTLGFRQFSHHFTGVRDALLNGDEVQARKLLASWMRREADALPRSEIVRHVTEYSVLAAHRNVFGVFVWYALLAAFGLGPAGAVLYRISEYVKRVACRMPAMEELAISPVVRSNAVQAWAVIDWLPARMTALSFAFVGSFEDAIDAWRVYEASPGVTNEGILIAATAGAVNMQLGEPPAPLSAQQAQPDHLRAVVGLVWRTVVMWMVLLFLLSLARLIG